MEIAKSKLKNFSNSVSLIIFISKIFHTAIVCAPLAKLSNGMIVYSTNTTKSGSYHPGTIATYQCNDGFGINEGSMGDFNHCISTLTGYWNGDHPSCIGTQLLHLAHYILLDGC